MYALRVVRNNACLRGFLLLPEHYVALSCFLVWLILVFPDSVTAVFIAVGIEVRLSSFSESRGDRRSYAFLNVISMRDDDDLTLPRKHGHKLLLIFNCVCGGAERTAQFSVLCIYYSTTVL